MPSTSAKQHRFMEAVAHSPGFAHEAGVPQKVGKDFAKADDKAGITKTHKGKKAKNAKPHPFGQPHLYNRKQGGADGAE